jgi:hypothetical protein
MITPTVHLNGTSGPELLQQTMDSLKAIRLAQQILQNNAPHSRDYYVQGPDAWRQANDGHVARMLDLNRMATEFENSAIAISDQIRDRQ